MQTDLTTLPLSGNIYNGMGYSDMALVASVSCMVGLMVICRLIAGFRKFANGLPMGGTNSAVISAACHVRYLTRLTSVTTTLLNNLFNGVPPPEEARIALGTFASVTAKSKSRSMAVCMPALDRRCNSILSKRAIDGTNSVERSNMLKREVQNDGHVNWMLSM